MKTFLPGIMFALALVFVHSTANAQDTVTVFQPSETRGFTGALSKVSKDGVVVTQRVGNREETITANNIVRVDFQGEPPALILARNHENSGRLSDALTGYETALAAAGSENLKIELNFLIARVTSKLAANDPAQLENTLTKLKSFVNLNREHYRFYAANALLGETALVANDFDTAESAFRKLQDAPWPELKTASKIGLGRSLIAQNKASDARKLFEEAIQEPANTPAEKMSQHLAQLGLAECMLLNQEVEPAKVLLQKVVSEADKNESRVLAEAYIHLGNAYLMNPTSSKDALLAYLHVDVIASFAAYPDLHAESLFHLAQLWPIAGQPARGIDASARLQQEYPTSEWAKKLSLPATE